MGPVGDLYGYDAQRELVRITPKYEGRIYAPPGKYFSGPDKELLLKAADWTLLPSRFEPCGLVDIEFGACLEPALTSILTTKTLILHFRVERGLGDWP